MVTQMHGSATMEDAFLVAGSVMVLVIAWMAQTRETVVCKVSS